MPQRSCNANKLNGDTGGTATLELAVILPFLMTLGFGTYEFGNLIYNYHLITAGVRDASRYLAGNPQGVSDAIAAAKNIAIRGTIDSNGTFRIPWWNDANTISIDYSLIPNDDGLDGRLYRGGDTVTTITVTATVPYHQLGFLEFLSLGPITLKASHEERAYQNR
jgi:Flp pilus assembly protein TadG